MQCATVGVQILMLNGLKSTVGLFECSVFHSDSLKHKVTVEKDTLNIKKAVFCSEVGQSMGWQTVSRSVILLNSITIKALFQIIRHLLV